MMTRNSYKSAVALILLLLGSACDAFVVDKAPSKPALWTRLNAYFDPSKSLWEQSKKDVWEPNHQDPREQRYKKWEPIKKQDPQEWEQSKKDQWEPNEKDPRKQRYEKWEPIKKQDPQEYQFKNNLHREQEYPPPLKPQVVASPREQELETQIQELRSKLARMTASTQENAQVFVTLLDVSDNLARALDAVPAKEKETNDALKTLCDGIKLTEKGLDRVFEMSGIVKYGKEGDPFDHHIHHALCEYFDPEMEPDTIGHIIKAGYLLNEEVLRCAEVAVVKSEPNPDETCDTY